MLLSQIGFYTMYDRRAATANEHTRLTRAEIILTGRCNFNCPYCRHVGGPDEDLQRVKDMICEFAKQGLYSIRLSGGEPTIYPGIIELVELAKSLNIMHIALSTNGAASQSLYQKLIDAGANDFSISLDACCAEDGDSMAGGVKGAWAKVVANIKFVASQVYTTVGIVLTESNIAAVNDTVRFAHTLGVADIRVIPAAQCADRFKDIQVDAELRKAHMILAYRYRNFKDGRPVRGLRPCDNKRCPLVLDDVAVNQGEHFPCIIYMREGGKAIGKVGPDMREERAKYYREHDVSQDTICNRNCLDVCVDYNNRYAELHKSAESGKL